ncbi:hypothetical protein COO60DRAFT_126175 [Scenedesmus sp. NREL 46B-D3]|nr:hypothetical protein COO60DRAFT_126175 [Scenedesmus sp. NREL 46B-D3]
MYQHQVTNCQCLLCTSCDTTMSCPKHQCSAEQNSHPTISGSSVEPSEFSEALFSRAHALPFPPSTSPSASVPANSPPSPAPSASSMSGGALPNCRSARTTLTSPLLLLQTGSSLLFGVVAVEAGAEPEAAANSSPECSKQSPKLTGAATARPLPEGADDTMPANGDDMTRSDTGGTAACMLAMYAAAASCCWRAASLPAAEGHTDGCTISFALNAGSPCSRPGCCCRCPRGAAAHLQTVQLAAAVLDARRCCTCHLHHPAIAAALSCAAVKSCPSLSLLLLLLLLRRRRRLLLWLLLLWLLLLLRLVSAAAAQQAA